MENEFKQIQLGVDSILGTKTIIRRKKKSNSDKKREVFYNIINMMEELSVRESLMYADFNLDLSNYDEKFYSVIDTLLFMHFGKQGIELISFYLYDRLNSDGTINPVLTDDDKEIILNTPYDLWNLLCQVNPKLDE